MTSTGVAEIGLARERILQAFASRSIPIDPKSELWFVLDEMDHFCKGTRDLKGTDSQSATDDRAVEVGRDLLRGLRIDNALDSLTGAKVPHLSETLRTLSSFTHGNTQHRFQFDQSEYELHMAAQFQGHGQRISFVDTRRPSRYRQRVEFMVGYKYPVECKHPQAERRIVPNIDAALQKLEERQMPGILCIGLENALPLSPPAPYLEVLSVQDAQYFISQHFAQWLSTNRKRVEGRLEQSCGRFIIFTYSVLAYVHSAEAVYIVSMRLAMAHSGEWIESEVVKTCINRLKSERSRRLSVATNSVTKRRPDDVPKM